MGAPIRMLVLDVLKPLRGPSIVDVAREIAALEGVDGVNLTVKEIDVETLTVSITIEGPNIDFEKVKEKLDLLGCVIHSVDQVVAGRRIVDEPPGVED